MFGGALGGAGGGVGGGAAAGGAPAGEAKEEKKEEVKEQVKSTYDIELAGIDAANKIKIIKEVRQMFGLGLKEAKDAVESAPTTLQKAAKREDAEKCKEKLAALGCTVNLL